MASLNVAHLVSACVDLGERAATIIRDVQKTDFEVVEKPEDDGPVTIADRNAQATIAGGLARAFPALAVLGEEDVAPSKVDFDPRTDLVAAGSGTQVPVDELTVWIDPLDATKAFTTGDLAAVTVLIGIARGDAALAGVIAQPFFAKKEDGSGTYDSRIVFGVVGEGAYTYTAPGHAAPIAVHADPDNAARPADFTIATTRSHWSDEVAAAMEKLDAPKVVRAGGVGNKILLILDGDADAYVYPRAGTKKWDTCAPEALLVAAGGRLTDCYGRLIPYGKDARHLNLEGALASLTHHAYYTDVVSSVMPTQPTQ